MSRTLFLLLLALFAALPALSAEPAAPTADACAIRHQDQLLLVQDRISSRYSLSGGYIAGGESPQQAALRELYEETGLRGEVVQELGRWQRAVIFACRTLEPIVAQQGTVFVSILKAPNLGGEILNARLIAVDKLPREQRRFPDQLDWLQSRLDKVPESEVHWQADFVAQGNGLHQAEIPLMLRLQQWLGPDVWWLSVSNLFGSGGFQLALIPLLLPLLGWPRLRQLLFAMLWLGLLVQASKEGIGWPRPFHLQPLLATQSAQGFGMPSGHTASALLFWGALLGWLWPARRGLAYSLALLLALTTGLARVWLGVHFISDVAAGLLIGALLLAVRPYWRLDQRASAWGLLIAAALVCAGLSQSAHLAGIGLAAFGLWVGGLRSLTRGGYPPILTGAVTLAGGAVIGAGLWALPLLTSSSLTILLGQFVLFFGLGLWLSAGLWWILSFLKCDTRPKGNGSDKGTI
ncbi:phosphatidic acid phosphatase [Aeromonas sp. HMWF036]|uniref:phosphatase PAP2 family protein n=1 Tax=unclassified Aeromonas TaxID=257493 RepID=UPI000D3B743E|nr:MULTISPECIES: phosphatase PAP2 family protein [unclassified Aeromonas]PTS81460.1 phosphatidic acid phosphatase [Aeromonas sp. HMWF036]PTT26955.1 phosphatidic acid phosphatase [Aeromonas sp. HMWF017]